MPTPTRPLLRYHGGKWKLARWIISHFPGHRIYVEPFGGAGSVLLRKAPAYADIYNDLDGEVVSLFRVLQHPDHAQRLLELLHLTPFARAEFELAYQPCTDPVERSRRLIIRSLMGFGSDGVNDARPTGFRANSSRSGTTPAHDWASYPAALRLLIERLRGVVIENRDARAVMAQNDGPDTLIYADPPYLHGTRKKSRNAVGKNYRHELTDADHAELLAFLTSLTGMVILSGYPSDEYDAALPGWQRVERAAHADGAKDRTEVLWINPACTDALGNGPLFAAA